MNVNGNTRLIEHSKLGQVEDKMLRSVKPAPTQPKVRSGEPAQAQAQPGAADAAQQNPLLAVMQKLFEAIQGLISSMFGGGDAAGAGGAGGAEAGAAGGPAGAAGGMAAAFGAAGGAAGPAGPATTDAAGAGAAAAPGMSFDSASGFIFFGFAMAGQQQGAAQEGSAGTGGTASDASGMAGAAWGASTVNRGQAEIDLGPKYGLKLNENRSEMILVNKETGHETRVWGDPHIDYDNNGQTADDAMFKGTMTFKLPDDTKVTINTQPAGNGSGETYADKLTITKGDDAFVVNGLSQNQRGDLTVEHRTDGKALEAATADGYVMTERADGQGFISESLGRRASKRDLEQANA